MKDCASCVMRRVSRRVVRAVFAAAVVVGCGSAWADIPASAYVQRGLVAQFDGIENAKDADGNVVHSDADGSKWLDLVSGEPVNLYASAASTPTIGANHYAFAGKGDYFVTTLSGFTDQIAVTGGFTVEMASEYSSLNNLGIAARIGGQGFYYQSNCLTYTHLTGQCGSWQSIKANTFNSASITYTADVEATGVKSYLNGTLSKGNTAVTWSAAYNPGNELKIGNFSASHSAVGKIYAARFYNRILSADEIAVNAAIDKVRFTGLDPLSPSSWPKGYRYTEGKGIEVRVRVQFDASRGSVTVNGQAIGPDTEIWTPFNGEDANLTLVATPLEGFCFGRWKNVPAGVDVQQTTIELPANRVAEVTAVFNDLEPFVEMTGTQYFITDYYAGPTTKVEADMMVTELLAQQRFFGADSDQSTWPFSFSVYQNGSGNFGSAAKDGAGNWDGTSLALSSVVDKHIVLTLDAYNGGSTKYKIAVTDAETGKSLLSREPNATTRTKTGTTPLVIAGDYIQTPPIYPAHMRIYSVKIWEKDQLVRCYVPYWDEGKSTVGLKELLSGTVVSSGGSGTPLCCGELKADSNVYLPDGYRYSEEGGCEARMNPSPKVRHGECPLCRK